ncbi:hypothetical protein, partial [Limnobacter sp.]|uniref:hypothetical protein n=1 Tax=Limnobacter sp. TaxID=2003368 RepID=UPI0027329CCF
MALTNSSATSIALAGGTKTQPTAPVIDLTLQDSGSLSRQGDDLIIRLPNGVTEVHANFFIDPDAVFTQPGSQTVFQAEMLVAAFNFLRPAVVLAQANLGTPGNPTLSDAGERATEIDGAAVSKIAQVAEADGAARRVRGRVTEVVRPGDEVVDGDVLTNGGQATIQLVFARSLSNDAGDTPITGSMGPTSRVQFLADEGADGLLTARLTLFSGALEISNLPDNGEQFYITTPAGVVVARGQGVSVSVDPRNGETTVVALGVPNLSID